MTAERIDLYAVLGLPRQATQAQIRRAYRVMARQNHPDTRLPADLAGEAHSDALLREALAAYAVLGDPHRRADYDRRSAPSPRHDPHPVRTVGLFPGSREHPLPPTAALTA